MDDEIVLQWVMALSGGAFAGFMTWLLFCQEKKK